MKTFLLRVLAGTVLIAFLLFGYSAGANAALVTKILDEDTKLLPPGITSVSSIPVFKKGTTVTLNENGEIIEGVLATDPWLNCVPLEYEENGMRYFRQYGYVFREGTKVTFNDKGEVFKGTFSHNHDIKIAVPINARNYVTLKPLSEVRIHSNGVLASGTLKAWQGIYLRPLGWQQIRNLTDNTGGLVSFKDGTLIELNTNGEVTKGTLNKDTMLPSPTGIKGFKENTMVEFTEKGIAIETSK